MQRSIRPLIFMAIVFLIIFFTGFPYQKAFCQSKIYWTDGTVGKIQRANLDGSNVEDLVMTSPEGSTRPCGISLDVDIGELYWADFYSGVYSADLDGSCPVVVVEGEFYALQGIDLDVSAGKIYYGPTYAGYDAGFDAGHPGKIIVFDLGSSTPQVLLSNSIC